MTGLLATFADPAALRAAATRLRALGYTRLDGHTPLPVDGLAEALGHADATVPRAVFLGGLVGGLVAFFGQSWMSAIDYPLNVGGRAPFSWPAFVVLTFELTVLGAALAGFAAFLWRTRLPRPHHPLFAAPGFERALVDRFMLSVAASDPRFDAEETRRLLAELQATEVVDVP